MYYLDIEGIAYLCSKRRVWPGRELPYSLMPLPPVTRKQHCWCHGEILYMVVCLDTEPCVYEKWASEWVSVHVHCAQPEEELIVSVSFWWRQKRWTYRYLSCGSPIVSLLPRRPACAVPKQCLHSFLLFWSHSDNYRGQWSGLLCLLSLHPFMALGCRRRAGKISDDSSHSANHLSEVLPPAGATGPIKAKTRRFRLSFFPEAIRVMQPFSSGD